MALCVCVCLHAMYDLQFIPAFVLHYWIQSIILLNPASYRNVSTDIHYGIHGHCERDRKTDRENKIVERASFTLVHLNHILPQNAPRRTHPHMSNHTVVRPFCYVDTHS